MAAEKSSPNPAVEAMQSLMGGGGMSRPSDAPTPDKLSEPMRKVAERIRIPEDAQSASQPSPASVASNGSTLEGTHATSAMTATASTSASGPQYVAEPTQMDDNGHLGIGEDGAKAFSYPGPPPQQQEHDQDSGPSRGRRSSFGGDDDGAMDGVEYTGGDEDDEAEVQARRGSEPSRKRAHLESAQDPNRDVYRQHSSTYPPIGPGQGRPHSSSVSNMGPPQVMHPGSSTATSPRDMSGHPSPAGGSSSLTSSYYPPGQLFQQQGGIITESPKPLSPGQPGDQQRLSVDATMGARNRSPSLTTQFQQQHFGRGSGRGTPPQHPTSLPFQPGVQQQAPHGPVLPPIPAVQPQTRAGLHSSIPAHGPSMLQHGQLPPPSAPSSQPGSLSSHGRSSGSSIRDVLGATGQDAHDIWNIVRTLEQKLGRMSDEYELRISRLQEEVISLKAHVAQMQAAAASSYSSDMSQRPY
ncbi:hypothetical protein B0A50_04869 [Salinomyces thailandicus]|uniref:Uncharacterized protein n=1 Tax=Salinomyces thailandicus TaxID=706561 RepID=A0A4U0TZ52_9PEZI|nr:hypothetical protein B0A50_04869 [Salinomyces thailandica]